MEIVLSLGICLLVFVFALVAVSAVLLIPLMIYFLPWLIARSRRHPNSFAIFWFNFLLGWSMLGWIAILCWSLTSIQQRGRYAVA